MFTSGLISPSAKLSKDTSLLGVEVDTLLGDEIEMRVLVKGLLLIELLADFTTLEEHGQQQFVVGVGPLDQLCLETVVHVEQVVGILTSIVDHLCRKWPDSPVSTLVLLVRSDRTVMKQEMSQRVTRKH